MPARRIGGVRALGTTRVAPVFLKSLSMKGFKSFADPTVLEFEPGITVVVGPNGSGKSNVVDAVTWVLGAQGPRSLRSAKMEDVIFAGTSSRAALGRAEVSLTIDNASGKLPIDLAEVTITRTLFRSGDSEYAINGAPCRLLDVQELLSDSGVGRQQHMIIGQGQLDTVLNARPEDRRAIIEEAAGVLKHRRRRERAERRLAGTAENLERLGDLVREVRRQIRPLERQAAAARSHDTVATELLTIRRYLAGTELAELSSRRTAATQSLTICREEEHELHAALEVLDAEASSTSAELSSHREEDLARALGRVQGLVERARGTSGVLRERGRAVVAALDAAADVDVVSTLEAEAAHLAAEIARAGDGTAADPEQAELETEAGGLDAEEAALRDRWADVLGDDLPEDAMAKVRARTEPLARAVAREQQDMTALDARLAGLEQRHAAAAVRADLLDNESAALEATTARLEAAVAAGRVELEGAAERAEAAQRRADEGDQARHRSAARAEALERALRDLQGAGGRELLARGGRRGGLAARPGRDRRGLGGRVRGRGGGGRGRGGGRRAPVGPSGPGHPARARGDRRGAGSPDATAHNGAHGATAERPAAPARPSRHPRTSTCPRVRAPSRSAAMCGHVTGRPWLSPCSMR